MSLRLLKFSGGSVDGYEERQIVDAVTRPSCPSRARSAATSVGMSAYPFSRRKPFTASKTPAATQRGIIWPLRQRLTLRFTCRVRLRRLSAAFVVASERRKRGESFSVSTVSLLPFARRT